MLLPSGTVTLLFTDIAGSTRLWQEHPLRMPSVLARHDTLLRQAIEQNNGFVVKTIGDAFMAVFATAQEALQAALLAQRSLLAEPWSEETPVRVRMGLHTGVTEERDNDYFGHEVNRAARIQAVVHPQQIVLSQSVYRLVQERLPDAVTLLDLGRHQLKDLREPENLWQLCHPDLPSTFPPLNSLTHWPNNLTRQLSSFVGRDREIAEVKELLARCSCLTLTGSGGCGKTRLALQVAAEMLPDFPHGVWLVELASLLEPSLVPQTVASALGLREEPGRSLLQTLAEYANPRTLLLVLDNCEHLLDACAQLTDTLLRACPQMKVLSTSREAFNLGGEQTYRVPSMSLPDPKQPQTPVTLQQYEASRLFVERASAVKSDFLVTDANAPALASVCQHLDGIPLAIELAAVRVRSLSVEEIAGRLGNRFHLLTGGSRAALPRHHTLRALIAWSYDLLNAQEKTLLCRLAVFAGGWHLEAAEAVCSAEGRGDSVLFPDGVLDLLSSLVDKSLVLAEEREGSVRYRMLENIRQYGRERMLESGEGADVESRYRDWFVSFAEEAEPKLLGPEQAIWLERLEREHDNLRAVLAYDGQEAQPSDAGLHLAGALVRFWVIRGYYSEGQMHLVRALEREGGQAEPLLRAKALNGMGTLTYQQGDYVAARNLYEESLRLQQQGGNPQGVAVALNNLGMVAEAQGDFSAARTLYEEGLALLREQGDRQKIASLLNNLGLVAYYQGDHAAARALHEESLALRQELGDQQGIAVSLGNLGLVPMALGDYAGARVLYEQALSLYRELSDRKGSANTLLNLGLCAKGQGDPAAALALLEESLAIHKELGDRRGNAMALNTLGEVTASQGDDNRACSLYAQALRLLREIGDRRNMTESLEGLAGLLMAQNKVRNAVCLWGAAEALHERIGSSPQPDQRRAQQQLMEQARAHIGEEVFKDAWAKGYRMTQEQAIACALKEVDA